MSQYDSFAEQYHEMVQNGGPENAYRYIIGQLEALSDLHERKICDVGCGQGELSSRLALLGADVTGVDLSGALLKYAQEKTTPVTWVQDDAMELKHIPDAAYDYVVSSVMLMDVPDHRSVFHACHRILKPNGIMIWVIMHPCFQSPFSHPLGDGSRKVLQYAPQFWKSAGTGTIRSTLGAFHRPIATYINDFMEAGFSLIRIDEPERLNSSVDQLPSLFGAVGKKLIKP
ncbi:class I SAM-dependent methyltransferase [Paenibacillus sp. UNC451MF]|uniref:class I SAM-dependent methyltransferase n=1 Tax=Paenibacillus sp. UNC451MF TaxID=1449063 RepID=UPI000490E38F|nr:class I SAM-dependent methyltransferase [Paenibacillus sp. UNC451MF]